MDLGRQAVAFGLEAQDVTKIHQSALATNLPSRVPARSLRRADVFFAQTMIPIAKNAAVARKTKVRLGKLTQSLGQRTLDLAASHHQLKQGIVRRKTVQEALKKSRAHSKALLLESHRLQRHLQQLTHQILRAQEDKRTEISRDLQHEIAQTLLGINIRLLKLKTEAAVNTQGIEKDIARTQHLVDISVASVKRFARQMGENHET
jgi:signal transduction histidine kinase